MLIAEALDLASHRAGRVDHGAGSSAVVARCGKPRRRASPSAPTDGSRTSRRPGSASSTADTSTRRASRTPPPRAFCAARISRTIADAGGSGAFAIDLISARVRTALRSGRRRAPGPAAVRSARLPHRARLFTTPVSIASSCRCARSRPSRRASSPIAKRCSTRPRCRSHRRRERRGRYASSSRSIRAKSTGWNAAAIVAALNTAPADNPYLTGRGFRSPHESRIRSSSVHRRRCRRGCDAASDLLLAESVHQHRQGNVARASAALDAASGGDSSRQADGGLPAATACRSRTRSC